MQKLFFLAFDIWNFIHIYPMRGRDTEGNPQLPNPVLPDQAVLPQMGLEREVEGTCKVPSTETEAPY